MMESVICKQRSQVWESTLALEEGKSLHETAVKELSEYFSKEPHEVQETLRRSQYLLNDEWNEKKIDISDEDSVVNFYNTTKVEMFELMDWHAHKFTEGPLDYVCAMEIAKRLKLRKYLDYGSGIGSAAIIFQKNSFEVTCADVSEPLMVFTQYRLKKRGLNVQFIDLKKTTLPNDSFDIITCFDVLEHLVNPLQVIKELRLTLRRDGILILNNVDGCSDKDRPMHIAHQKLSRIVRSLGFLQRWDLEKEFEKSSDKHIFVLQKVERPFWINALFYCYDSLASPQLARITKFLLRRI